MNTNKIELLGQIIKDSNSIMILSGAGISTSAGIPDFRGPNGLYSRKDFPTDQLFDINYFKHNPSLFYENIGEFLEICKNATPSAGHILIKKLEDLDKLTLVVTQNIDGLHTKAGNEKTLDIHGNFNQFICLKCERQIMFNETIYSKIKSGRTPLCDNCGAAIKPSVVFFGEDVIKFEEATLVAQNCDLFLSIGSSMVVNPAASLADYIPNKAAFVILNKGKTPYDNQADLKIEENIDAVANMLIDLLNPK